MGEVVKLSKVIGTVNAILSEINSQRKWHIKQSEQCTENKILGFTNLIVADEFEDIAGFISKEFRKRFPEDIELAHPKDVEE